MRVDDKVITAHLEPRLSTFGREVHAPSINMPMLYVKCGAALWASALVAAVHEQPMRCRAQGAGLEPGANLQNRKEQQDRNMRLLRMGAKLHTFDEYGQDGADVKVGVLEERS